MAEYIEREEVLKHKRKMSGADFGGEFWDEAVLCEDIRKIPTADVVEVKYGYWEEVQGGAFRCSKCHHGAVVDIFNRFVLTKHCHNCGVKMDGQGTTNNNIAAKIEISKVKEMLEQIKCRFYYHFEELMPSIMADEIDEIFKEYCEK